MQQRILFMSLPAVLLLGVGIQASSASPEAGPVNTEVEFTQAQPKQEGQARTRQRRARLSQRVWAALGNPEVQERLGMTPEQIQRLENGAYEFRQRQIQLRAEIQQGRLELRRLLREDPADRNAVESAFERVAQARIRLERERLNWRLDSREILTPAQKEEIRSVLKERRQEQRERRRQHQARP